jgi:N-acetyl-anhydromuramyl-L-alanine amidase AmpD
LQFKLRNKLHKIESVAGATIQFTAASTKTVVLSAVTNVHGVSNVNVAGLPVGRYTCAVTAQHTSSDPVGPSLVSFGPIPDRVYRPVTLELQVGGAGFSSVTISDPHHASVMIGNGMVTVDIQPVWMKSSANSNRGQSISMIVVHHTACAIGPAVSTFLAEKAPHYMIDIDGQIVKWVQDVRAAWHAGVARWDGHSDINSRSIGIEIVHTSGSYPAAQYASLLDLLTRLRTAHTGIDPGNVVGHSDVGTNSSGLLGRKSGDPGPHFEWSRLENRGIGLVPIAGPPAPGIYQGVFQLAGNVVLRRGDNDNHHRFSGSSHPQMSGTPIRELQDDLAAVGYSVGTPDGDFGDFTQHAVNAFQEHFFAGGRGHKSPDGRVDFLTAAMIKSVAQNTATTTTSQSGATSGGLSK